MRLYMYKKMLRTLDEYKIKYANSTLGTLNNLAENACYHKRSDILNYCIQNGANLQNGDMFDSAVASGSLECMQMLIDYGLNPHNTRNLFNNIFYEPGPESVELHIQTVIFLIKLGVFKDQPNTYTTNRTYITLLYKAIQNDCLYIVELLLHPQQYELVLPDFHNLVKNILNKKDIEISMTEHMREYLQTY